MPNLKEVAWKPSGHIGQPHAHRRAGYHSRHPARFFRAFAANGPALFCGIKAMLFLRAARSACKDRAFADLPRIFCYPSEQGALPATSDAPRGGDSRTQMHFSGRWSGASRFFRLPKRCLQKAAAAKPASGLEFVEQGLLRRMKARLEKICRLEGTGCFCLGRLIYNRLCAKPKARTKSGTVGAQRPYVTERKALLRKTAGYPGALHAECCSVRLA